MIRTCKPPKSVQLCMTAGLCVVLLLAGCGHGDSDAGEEQDGNESAGEHSADGNESAGEHSEGAEESGEHGNESAGEHSEGAEGSEGGEGAEESGTQYTKADTYDETRGGVRLLLTYDADQDAFVGTVENTTDDLLDQVRIEVHLSNGVELGPTTPGDLPAGQTREVILPADGEQFQTWSAHPEVGRDEHSGEGSEGDGSGEHSGEDSEGDGSGEHGEGAEGSEGAEESGEHSGS